MWFLDQWEPGSPTNNGARAVRLAGDLDVAALERALRAVVERHEILVRSTSSRGGSRARFSLDEWSLELPVVDLASVEPEGGSPSSRGCCARSRGALRPQPDLMLRPTLFRLGPAEHVLLLVHPPHRVRRVVGPRAQPRARRALRRVRATGGAPELPELPIQYADYAVWQRERLQGPLLEELARLLARRARGRAGAAPPAD